PLTLDYPFLKRMLRDVQTGLITDGTAVGTAIATATARLRESEAVSKIIILLTDGENNAGTIDPSTAAELAEALGVKIYSIGVGGEGRPPRGLFDQLTGPPSMVDEETLRDVAERSGGRYFRATDAEALRSIYDAISELEKTEIEENTYVDVKERYAWFLWPAVGMFLLSILLETTRLRRIP
ncbi:MAG: VWA domain-containing protein, partial [Rubricoccaceae bacterium]|nr:VWA domain-containing protein [Rubricoccaceae bacterium]